MTPRDLGRYAPANNIDTVADRVTAVEGRLSNVEQILLRMEAQQTPKWMRTGGWTAIVGSVLGVAIKVWLEK